MRTSTFVSGHSRYHSASSARLRGQDGGSPAPAGVRAPVLLPHLHSRTSRSKARINSLRDSAMILPLERIADLLCVADIRSAAELLDLTGQFLIPQTPVLAGRRRPRRPDRASPSAVGRYSRPSSPLPEQLRHRYAEGLGARFTTACDQRRGARRGGRQSARRGPSGFITGSPDRPAGGATAG